jgi:hypothetical protein
MHLLPEPLCIFKKIGRLLVKWSSSWKKHCHVVHLVQTTQQSGHKIQASSAQLWAIQIKNAQQLSPSPFCCQAFSIKRLYHKRYSRRVDPMKIIQHVTGIPLHILIISDVIGRKNLGRGSRNLEKTWKEKEEKENIKGKLNLKR